VRKTPLRKWLDALPQGERIGRLHKVTEIPLRSLHRYADGTKWPSLDRAAEIAKATGLPLADVANPKDLATLAALGPLASHGEGPRKSPDKESDATVTVQAGQDNSGRITRTPDAGQVGQRGAA
jgi:hypothetical protein